MPRIIRATRSVDEIRCDKAAVSRHVLLQFVVRRADRCVPGNRIVGAAGHGVQPVGAGGGALLTTALIAG